MRVMMAERKMLLRLVLHFSIIYALLKQSDCHAFVCLDTVTLCDCDPTKLAINCSNLRFHVVPLADIPNDTSSLSFGGNFLTAVMTDTFATLGSLLRMSLKNNLIGYVEPWAFNATNQLTFLDLSGNRLSTVPSALSVLTSLRVLNMSDNGLTYLSTDDFSTLTKLETLRLENNKLHTIPDTLFYPMADLNLLYLDGNSISADPIGWFANTTRLTQLRLSGNSITLSANVENWFGANLQSVPLEELHLSNNVIQEISQGTFRGCVNLKELHLSSNEIKTIASGSFDDLENLQNLTLDGNMLSGEFPEDLFANAEKLTGLYLQDNSLSAIPRDAANGLDQILEVNLARNQLVDVFTCDEACSDTVILPAITILHLQSNLLSVVPEVRNFSNLQILDLSANSIATMESYVFNGTSMRLLSLHDNTLSTMSLENFQTLPDLEVVTITGNPWICDCNLFWIVDPDEEPLAWRTKIHNEVLCQAPDFAKDLDLNNLYLIRERHRNSGPFVPCETANWIVIAIICVVWVVAVVVVLGCYFSKTMNYRKGYVKRTMKIPLPKAPPVPPSTVPSTSAHLNEGATFDELDKSTVTDVTYLHSARDDGGETPEVQGKDVSPRKEKPRIEEYKETLTSVV